MEVVAHFPITKTLDLIQDFGFPTAATRVRVSQDFNYIASSGVYPPQARIFDLSELSMKCQRNFDAEIVQFYFLSEDYKKLAFLLDNRSIELHAQYGKHYSTRIPRFGRDMTYNPFNCELYIVGATNEAYRLNLEQGRFMASLESEICNGLNVCELNKELKWILACGGEDGLIECWDLRQRNRISLIETNGGEISALSFDDEGLYMGVGHNSGVVQIYDIRYSKPIYSIKHHNKTQIKGVKFHSAGQHILTSDTKGTKITNKINGKLLTTIESEANINDIELCGKSGLIFIPNESPKIEVHFIPALGPAPTWCPFLENLTEEFEEKKPKSVLDNKQFVTIEELEKLNGTDLIGTEELEAYMHGYLMDTKLYYKLQALAMPFDYNEYRKERIKKKLEEKTAERITIRKRLPKVNKNLAQELLSDEKNKKKVKGKELLEDSRFSALFNDEKFQINTESEDYLRLHRRQPKEKVEEIKEDESDEESDENIIAKVPKKRKIDEGAEEIEDGMSDEERPFRERMEEDSHEKKKHGVRVKKSKVLKEKPDMKNRRPFVPLHKLLKSK
ncbi:NOL10 [Blepharisma stoltei]|uniref:Nucleolar protein 10 n=1 Tax=Blepharisma stoltei TaxID=1481888 RepID=A0AAU9ID92_9CILI|nr:unnamed protein product [Blepharisma stoltei]